MILGDILYALHMRPRYSSLLWARHYRRQPNLGQKPTVVRPNMEFDRRRLKFHSPTSWPAALASGVSIIFDHFRSKSDRKMTPIRLDSTFGLTPHPGGSRLNSGRNSTEIQPWLDSANTLRVQRLGYSFDHRWRRRNPKLNDRRHIDTRSWLHACLILRTTCVPHRDPPAYPSAPSSAVEFRSESSCSLTRVGVRSDRGQISARLRLNGNCNCSDNCCCCCIGFWPQSGWNLAAIWRCRCP